MTHHKYKIYARYKVTKTCKWGRLDKRIEVAFSNNIDGAGTILRGTPVREIDGTQDSAGKARKIANRLKKIPGVQVEIIRYY